VAKGVNEMFGKQTIDGLARCETILKRNKLGHESASRWVVLRAGKSKPKRILWKHPCAVEARAMFGKRN